jgi:hypothetical protein|tara:strand:+ start:413 stop:748 length:336 start_codon:yes stop_codon:yes gene_type:complete
MGVHPSMGWWPFRRKRVFHSEPHIKGSKMWIQDLRECCERNFDQRAEGQLEVSKIREKWRKAHSDGEVDEPLLEGLERRSDLLIEAKDSEWSKLLDDEGFWKAGWGSKVED